MIRKLFLVLAFSAWVASAGTLADECKARRAKLMERLGPQTLLVLHSAPERVYSLDIEYEYRQDSDFYYLTGIDQPDSTLILMPGNAQHKEFLFVLPRDLAREHWTGRRLSGEDAAQSSGIQTVYESTQEDAFLEAVLAGRPFTPKRDQTAEPSHDFDTFFGALKAGDARIAAVVNEYAPRLPSSPPAALQFVNRLRDRFPGLVVTDATAALHGLRQVKSAYEREMLEKSADVSAEAHLAGMRAAKPGAHEYEVKAAIEQVYRAHGTGWGYPSITGSGPNATILHYAKAQRRMDAGDLMLVDAAASYGYYTVDITRTYPVNGKFSELQKEIYRIVLAAQDAMRAACKPGVRTRDVHRAGVDVIKAGLLRLGLITDKSDDQYRMWYTHGSVHYIGIDVHDVGDYELPIAAGNAFTMEPGIYIRPEALDALPKTVENVALIEKIKPAVEKYSGIGVRIEDSFLMTDAGLLVLSAAVPRTVEEIEAALAKR
jgi:Xaa-Pro aminopeptidase